VVLLPNTLKAVLSADYVERWLLRVNSLIKQLAWRADQKRIRSFNKPVVLHEAEKLHLPEL
jgi:hypothetical protein